MKNFNLKYRGFAINIKETGCNNLYIEINGEGYPNLYLGNSMRLAKKAARNKIDLIIKSKK